MRELDPVVEAELDNAFLQPIWFVELQFDTGTVYLHTDLGVIGPYTGTGSLGSIGSIEETDGVTPMGVRLSLSGVDSTLLDEARSMNYQGRPLRILFSARDTITGQLLAAPEEVFYGYMDQMIITRGREFSTIEVTGEDERRRWDQAPIVFYDAATIQEAYSGETFFNYLPEMMNLQLRWGTANPNVDLGSPSQVSVRDVGQAVLDALLSKF